MSKIKRISTAAIATGALTVGALAFASPAMAGGPGTAKYTCTATGVSIANPVSATFSHPAGGNLSIVATLGFDTLGPTTITSSINGVSGGPTASLGGPAHYNAIALSGAWGTLTAAPTTIDLTATSGTTVVPIHCTYNATPPTQGGSWPV